MEQLNKTQIVLLTLLTSFVTAIATGIITVALMDDQVPAGVTQTVNRVVERTIETVVADKGQSAGVTKEVVIREENLVSEAISKVSESVVRLKGSDGNIVAMGIVINSDGLIVTDTKAIDSGLRYRALHPGGEEMNLKYVGSEGGLAILKPEDSPMKAMKAAKLGDSNSVKIGQTAIMIYGTERNFVSLGIIAASLKGSEGNNESFDSNLGGNATYGNPVFNLQGEVIGMRLPAETGDYITASNMISIAMGKLVK